MDARDRLRRYVEQRRELGETEFVLDGLPVEDVLRLLGAAGASRASGTNAAARVAEPTHRADTDVVKSSASANEEEVVGGVDAPAPAVTPPPVPDVRFDAAASTDWRKTLADLAPDTAARSANVAAKPDVPMVSPVANTSGAPPWIAVLDVPIGISVGETRDARPTGSLASASTLDEVARVIAACKACSLFSSATHPVPGEGNPDADFVCVGEAPGQSEDESGRPFVGAAGQLLTKILAAIQLPREEVFICNVLKHRPPGNRNPLPEEVRACSPYLTRQLELLRPRVILALGTFAAQTLLETTLSIGKLRGQVHRYHGVPLIVTYHPAALLRNDAWKRPTWEDVKLARRILDASRAANPSA